MVYPFCYTSGLNYYTPRFFPACHQWHGFEYNTLPVQKGVSSFGINKTGPLLSFNFEKKWEGKKKKKKRGRRLLFITRRLIDAWAHVAHAKHSRPGSSCFFSSMGSVSWQRMEPPCYYHSLFKRQQLACIYAHQPPIVGFLFNNESRERRQMRSTGDLGELVIQELNWTQLNWLVEPSFFFSLCSKISTFSFNHLLSAFVPWRVCCWWICDQLDSRCFRCGTASSETYWTEYFIVS
jgi:hypothetical protein